MKDNHMHTLGGLAALAGILLLFLLALGTLTIVVVVVLRQRIMASKSQCEFELTSMLKHVS